MKGFSILLVCFLTLGLVLMSCEDNLSIEDNRDATNGKNSPEVTGGNNEKALTIQNIPESIYAYFYYYGGGISIFKTGATVQQAMSLTGMIASADLSNSDITVVGHGPYTLTIPLYAANNSRWTGSGTFDIFLWLNNSEGYLYKIYKANSVNISSGITTIPFSKATEVDPYGGGSDSGLNGTWVNNDYTGEKWTFSDGNCETTADTILGSVSLRGPYTDNGSIITLTNSYVFGSLLTWYGLSPTKWYTIEEFNPAYKQKTGEDFGPLVETFSYRIVGNILYVTDQYGKEGSFTKQTQRSIEGGTILGIGNVRHQTPYTDILGQILSKAVIISSSTP
jgi:hypothetical protein